MTLAGAAQAAFMVTRTLHLSRRNAGASRMSASQLSGYRVHKTARIVLFPSRGLAVATVVNSVVWLRNGL